LAEDRVRRVLRSFQLSLIRMLFEKTHAVECLLFLYAHEGRWQVARQFMDSLDRPMSDGTYRASMQELSNLQPR
jgi:hypothetical protein